MTTPASPRARGTLLGALLLSGTLAAPSAAFEAQRMPVGVSVNYASPVEVDHIADLGLRYIRTDLAWSDVEQTPGVYRFDRYDTLLDAMQRRDLRAVLVLAYGNDLYGGGPPRTPEALRAYARFAAAAAARYAGRGVLWQLWNEPNLFQYWPPEPVATEYVSLAVEAANAIHAADPDAYVIGPATGGPEFDLAFVEATFRLGLLDSLDAVSVHPFGAAFPEAAEPFYENVRRLIRQYSPGRTLPLICGEWGYDIADQQLQAQYLVRSLDVNEREGIALTVWYAWQDDGFQSFGLVDVHDQPKLAIPALEGWLRPRSGRSPSPRPLRP